MGIPCRTAVRVLLMAACLGLAVLMAGMLPTLHGPLLAAQGQSETSLVLPAVSPVLPDPLPLRRLLIPPERVPFELQRARQGTLLHMTRAEFEARVAAAAGAGEALKNPPRLVEARYRASLTDTALIGTAQWTVVNPSAAAGILPLQPLNLALRQVRFDNGAAILGELDGKSLGLLVEQSGTHTLSLAWSGRGDPIPGGLRFELKVPSCVLTSFEMEIPADRAVALIGDNCLLSGPQPGASPNQRLWQLQCGGSTTVDLLIRPASASSASAPLVLARLRTKQRMAPDLLEADYDFNLEVLHGDIRELICEGDPSLRPTAVHIGSAEVETWEVRPGPTPGGPFNLWIRLPEQFQKDLLPLRIHCLAPVASNKRWTSPALRLRGAVSQGETLLLQVSPEVYLEDWQPGGFELIRATPEAGGEQLLTLQSGLGGVPLPGNGARGAPSAETLPMGAPSATLPVEGSVRPSARIRVQEPEYRARQIAWWQIGPDTASLSVHIDWEVIHGPLFRLPVLLPANWTLERVELSPKDLLRTWTPMPTQQGLTQLIVELQRSLESLTTARLTLLLRPPTGWTSPSRDNTGKPAELSMAFPEIFPQGARHWDGALAIRIDPLYEATVRTSLPAAISHRKMEHRRIRSEDQEERRSPIVDPLSSILDVQQSPWGAQRPDYLYMVRGQPARGSLTLRSRSARVRAHCSSEIVLGASRAAVLTRLLLQPEVGNPDTIDLLVSAPVSGVWNWRSEGSRNVVKGMQRLPFAEILPGLLPLGASTPLGAVGLFRPLGERATCWRLTLGQPLREPLLLETTFDLAADGPRMDAVSRLGPLAAGTVLESLALAVGGSEPRPESAQGRRWEVPLLVVLSAAVMEGEAQVYLAGGGVLTREIEGLWEIAPSSSSSGVAIPWRTFRYNGPPLSLVLHSHIAASHRPAAARVEGARLTTYVEPEGRLLNYYSFQVRNWKQRTFPLRLPVGAQCLAARVNGRWIARPTLHDATEDGPVTELPVAANATIVCFEVVYALENPAGTLWRQVHAPLPVLPIVAMASRHTWCLPVGFVPLYEGSFLCYPGPNPRCSDNGAMTALSRLLFADPLVTLASAEWRHRQERLVADADTHLRVRQREHKDRSLGDALHYLTYDFFKGQEILTVDAVALQEAGLQPATRVNEQALPSGVQQGLAGGTSLRSLESLGVVCLPCRSAPLLTTQRQWASWQTALDHADSVPGSVAMAVSEAVAYGHDRSGRFRTAADWLRDWDAAFGTEPGEEEGSKNREFAHPGHFTSLPHPESWTEWEPITDRPGEETLLILRHEALWGVACSLSGVLLLGWLWARRHWERLCYRLLLLWVGASILGLLWLPVALRTVFWWPMLAGIALAAARYLLAALQRRTPAPAINPSAVATAVLALVFVAGLPGQAAAPGPYTVWLLPGPADAPGNQDALVPPDLVEQLQVLARRGAAGLQGTLLQSADYHGTIANGVADFKAEFAVHCFTGEGVLLTLPLAGVELQEVLLDGSAAYPSALPPPQNGYALRVQGRGSHTIRTHFTVRFLGTGDERDLRFTIPELVQSQLTLLAPEGAHYLQAVGRGAQRVSPDAKGVRLEADLGRVGTLHVHWRQESRPSSATVEVKEAYYWDVQRSISRLVGLLDYTVTRGALTELTILLPESVEARRVELVSPSAGALGPRLKDWTLSGTSGKRRLRLEFQGPVTNNVQVMLELVPRQPLGHSAALSIPTPEGVSFNEGFLAYRVQGWQASIADLRGVAAIEPALFERHWQPAGIEYPGVPEQAYRFVRASGGRPVLRLDLHAPSLGKECVQDLTWYLGPQQVALRAKAKLTASQKDLVFVEWEIPPELIVAEVRGAVLRNWSRVGSRLQIWLHRSVAEIALEMTGWIVRPADRPGTPFQLPCPAFLGTAVHTTFVHLLAENGWALETDQLHNLMALPEPRPAEDERNYLSRESIYGGLFTLRPAAAHGELQTLSLVEVRDRRLTFSATVDYETGQSKSRTLTLHLRNWKSPDVRLETRLKVSRHEARADALGHTWTLELPPDVAGHIQCTLTGTVALDGDAEVVMPDVSIEEAVSSDRWVAAIGPALRSEEQRGLVPATAAALSRWPTAAERLRHLRGSVWKIDAPDWRLRLRTDFPLVESRPVWVLSAEQAAALVDGRRWLHEATYWLYQESGTHLGILLPKEATLIMASLDGSEVMPLQASPERLWLALTGSSGPRLLRLRWVFDADRERLDLPRLEKPRLENTLYRATEQRSPILWSVHIPPGYYLAHAGGNALQSSPVERYLHRAAAQLRASEVLAEHVAGAKGEEYERQLVNAQVVFYRHCRDAEYELALAERFRGVAINLDSLTARLQRLQADNKELARTRHFERICARAQAQSAIRPQTGIFSDKAGGDHANSGNVESSLTQQGTPTYWQVGDDQGDPHLRLAAVQVAERKQAFAYSGLLLVLFVVAWTLPSYPRVMAWVHAFWPEQIILLGGLGWLVWGENVALALLVLLGVVARLVYLGRWIITRLWRPAPATGTGLTSAT